MDSPHGRGRGFPGHPRHMQDLFATRPVALADGLAIVGMGVALFAVLELEKHVRRRFGPAKPAPQVPSR